jgi:hypothetical protein
MDGVQGTQIHDETQSNTMVSNYDNQQHFAITLYEDTVNVLRIRLNCAQQYLENLLDYDCRLVHHVDVWIDLNGDGNFDETENRVYQRSPINSDIPRDTYNFQISIPPIDDWSTKTGLHRMRIKLIPSEVYTRKCGNSDYSEIREYIVNIVPKNLNTGKICSLIDCRDLSQVSHLKIEV